MVLVESIKKFLHHLADPHCEQCEIEKENKWEKEHICKNCENLLLIIEKQRVDYQLLLDRVMKPPDVVDNRPEHEWQPITRNVPWHIRRHQLEMEDRKKAALLNHDKLKVSSNKTTEELEKDLLGEENVQTKTS